MSTLIRLKSKGSPEGFLKESMETYKAASDGEKDPIAFAILGQDLFKALKVELLTNAKLPVSYAESDWDKHWEDTNFQGILLKTGGPGSWVKWVRGVFSAEDYKALGSLKDYNGLDLSA